MPLTPEKIAALDKYYAQQALPLEPDFLTQLVPDQKPSGLTPEKIAALDAYFAQQNAPVSPSQAYAAEDAAIANANRQSGFFNNVLTGVKAQAGRSALGSMELVNDITGKKLIDPEVLALAQQGANTMDTGTGVGGVVGNIAGDWLSYIPIGVAAKGAAGTKTAFNVAKDTAKAGVKAGAISGYISPSGEQDASPMDRLTRAGTSAAVSGVVAPVAGSLLTGAVRGGQYGLAKMGVPSSKASISARTAARSAEDIAVDQAEKAKAVSRYENMLSSYQNVKKINDLNYENDAALAAAAPTQKAPELVDYINSQVNRLKDVAPSSQEAKDSLTFFKKIQRGLAENGEISVENLVQLEKDLNSRAPSRVEDIARLESEFSKKVSTKLDEYAKKDTRFGENREKTKLFFRNNLLPFRDPLIADVIGFNPLDTASIKDLRSGKLKELTPSMVQKINNIHQNIETPEQYKVIAQLLPEAEQKTFGKDVAKSIADRRGSTIEGAGKAMSHQQELLQKGRAAAYTVGAVTSGQPYYMASRGALETARAFMGKRDPIFSYVKTPVPYLSDSVDPVRQEAERLAQQLMREKAPKLLPDYTKSGVPAMQAYVDELAAKRASELAPSNIGQERAAFEAAQAKAAQIAQMEQQLAAQPALEARQAGVDPQTYAKFLEQQTPPVVPEAPIATQPNVYYNPQEMAIKTLNEARGAGKELVNPAFTNEEIINELMKLRLVGKRK